MTAEWQATLDDVTMDGTPVAMDTASSPWDSQAASSAAAEPASTSEGWANFDEAPSTTTPSTSDPEKPASNWADFSAFTSIESASMSR